MSASIIQKDANGLTFYCIMYTQRVKGTWVLKELYCHASDAGSARYQFHSKIPFGKLRYFAIVSIAPVVGYHVLDNHGDSLLV